MEFFHDQVLIECKVIGVLYYLWESVNTVFVVFVIKQ